MAELKYVEDDRGRSLVNIVEPDVPGSECEIWCYEDRLGKAVAHRQEDRILELTHRLGAAEVVSRFEPLMDGVCERSSR